jgi:adenosylcobinamide kinase/adenosylcobinamide-phosphate guanylyltransferase
VGIDGEVTGPGSEGPGSERSGSEGLGEGVYLIRLTEASVTGPSVVWAPQAGEFGDGVLESLAERLAGQELRAIFLGPAPGASAVGGEMPSVGCARVLARLRARGVIGGNTRCLLVGLGHAETHPARLEACLPVWGAELGSAGTVVDLSQSPDPRPKVERILVLGGSGSGKSAFAEQLVSAAPEVVYLATGPKPAGGDPDTGNPGSEGPEEGPPTEHAEDEEWAARVKKHQERRPDWWGTLETIDVAEPLRNEGRAILLDSVGTWLSGVLDRCGAWEDRPGWREELDAGIQELLTAWRERAAPLVAVSDEVGWSIVPSTESGRMYREELGRLNAKLADATEDVFVVVAGRLLKTDP